MKKLLLTISLIPIISFAQQKEGLHYFKNKDSLVGVKDKAGKIIIPAQFKIFGYLKDGDPVEEETIFLTELKKGKNFRKIAGDTYMTEKETFCIPHSYMIMARIISPKD